MPKICSVGGCTNHHMQNRKGSQRRARWVRVCGRQNLDGSEWIPTAKYVYICSQHFVSGKPNSDPDHPDYIPSIFLRTAESSLHGAKRLNRYNSAQKRRFGLVTDNKVTKKRKTEFGEKEDSGDNDSLTISDVEVMEANDDAVTTTSEIVNCTIVEDKQEDVGCTIPDQVTERQMLMDEIDNLRYERNMFSKKLIDTDTILKTMQLSVELIRENDKKCKFYTGLSWDVFLKTFYFWNPKFLQRDEEMYLL
ncbi:hypothetical protein ACJMK2_001759 [Sinanodonta woodiana]|uniref:THAP-type domain-containing protein n=1 Tax=Sinanodonta woodiana TaxID=1069815 RepID=A0ABD3XTA9_SINWO